MLLLVTRLFPRREKVVRCGLVAVGVALLRINLGARFALLELLVVVKMLEL